MPHRLGGENTENSGHKFICGCVTIVLPILKGNDMVTASLTLHFCSVHDLLFCPALQEWLSFRQVQIEHTFGEAMRLTESTCPRCMTMTQEMLHKQFPKRYPYSEKPEALRGTEGCKLE